MNEHHSTPILLGNNHEFLIGKIFIPMQFKCFDRNIIMFENSMEILNREIFSHAFL